MPKYTLNGLPVVDATDPVTFNVMRRDVQRAKPRDHHNCAAAIACKRQFKATDVIIGRWVSFIRSNDHYVRYVTPPALNRQMYVIDQKGEFHPGEYMLKAPMPSRKLGVKKAKGPKVETRALKVRVHKNVLIRESLLNKIFDYDSEELHG